MSEMTSAVANKLLRKYNEELQRVYTDETSCSIYTEIAGIDPVIPDYNFNETRCKIETLMQRISDLKHEINAFNLRTVLPNCGMTIDKALVYMSMLTKEKSRLEGMIKPTKKTLKSGFGIRNNQVEYDVINYEVSDVKTNYDNICKLLTNIQLELDLVNSTYTFEVPGIELE